MRPKPQRLWRWIAGAMCLTLIVACPLDPALARTGDEEPPPRPATPQELWDQAQTAMKMGEYQEADQWLKRLISDKPSDKLLFELQDKYGSGCFTRYTRVDATSKTGTQLLALYNAAVQRQATDPQQIRQLLGRLGRPDPDLRMIQGRLNVSSVHAVGPMLARLRDRTYNKQHGTLLQMLSLMPRQTVPPLLTVMQQTREADLRLQVIQVLDARGDRRAVGPLGVLLKDATAGEVVNRAAGRALVKLAGPGAVPFETASKALLTEARRHYERRYDTLTEGETPTVWWWDDEKGLRWEKLPGHQASDVLARRYASLALRADPMNRAAVVLMVSAAFQQEAALRAVGKSVPDGPRSGLVMARSAGWQVCNSGLDRALRDGNWSVAYGFCRALADVGRAETVASAGAAPSPLARALRVPDRWVRGAAAIAIVRVRPKRAFSGHQYVVSALALGLAEEDLLRAMLVDSNPTRAAQMQGELTNAGFQTWIAADGDAAHKLLVAEGGFHAVIMHSDVVKPSVGSLVRDLRKDPRLGRIPLVVLGGPTAMRKWKHLRDGDPAVFIPDVGSERSLAIQLRGYVAVSRPVALSDEEKAELARETAEHLVAVAGGQMPALRPGDAVKALIEALVSPEQGGLAAKALGAVPSADAQVALADYAANPDVTEAQRAALIEALCANIRAFGNRLDDAMRARLLALAADTARKLPPRLTSMLEGCVGLTAQQVGKRFSELD